MRRFLTLNEHPVERVARVGPGLVLLSLAGLGMVGPWGSSGSSPS